MKTQAKSAATQKPRTKTGAKSGKAKTKTSSLPAWVIGCYDGRSNGKLSSKKAYEK